MNKVTPQIIAKMDLENIAREGVEFFMGLDQDQAEVLRSKFEVMEVTESTTAKISNLEDRNDTLQEENADLEYSNDKLTERLSRAKEAMLLVLKQVNPQSDIPGFEEAWYALINGKTESDEFVKSVLPSSLDARQSFML